MRPAYLALLVACIGQATPTPEDTMHITASDAEGHGLPAVELQIDPGALTGSLFPDDGVYLTLSGPPGGLLLLQVYPAGPGGATGLERMLRVHFDKPWWQPLSFETSERAVIAGAERDAMRFSTLEGVRRVAWCGALLPARSDLLLVVGVEAPTPLTCAQLVLHPQLAPALASLVVD